MGILIITWWLDELYPRNVSVDWWLTQGSYWKLKKKKKKWNNLFSKLISSNFCLKTVKNTLSSKEMHTCTK